MRFAILFLAFFSSFRSYGQDRVTSRVTSYNTYIYKISDKEALRIYRKDLRKVKPSFFHTLADSFPTDSTYKKTLPRGHYLKVYAEKNKLNVSVTTIRNYEVLILDNSTDLCVQVVDTNGQIIKNADVRIKWKKLRYDNKTGAYTDKKSNKKGLLMVRYDQMTSFHELDRKYFNPLVRRAGGKLIYNTPVKYVWRPVRFVCRVPVDAVHSISRGWPQGTIQLSVDFFEELYDRMNCIVFKDWHCENVNHNRFQNKHKGYMVFNKPKYLPGDTVKFKAFIIRKEKPISKEVDVILNNYKKNILLTRLKPYTSGGYSYQFILHDSLELTLDRSYPVSLQVRKGKSYISGSFKYEDYELSKVQLGLRFEVKDHFRGKELIFYAKGTDENDLNLPDSKVEISVLTKTVQSYFKDHVFTPDTLYTNNVRLEPGDETRIVIPDSAFPAANFSYTLSVKLVTSDQQQVTKKEDINYYYSKKEIHYSLNNDSISFSYRHNENDYPVRSMIYGVDNFGNKIPIGSAKLPFAVKINPYYSDYYIKTDSMDQYISISKESSLIQCYTERTKDSLHIAVENTRNIPFSYFVYKLNKELCRGSGKTFEYNRKINSGKNYFVSIQYLWGGEIWNEDYKIPYNQSQLNVQVSAPKIVYPGQKTKILITITNVDGKPVPETDLTAYSITKKFDYTPPQLPDLQKWEKDKPVINTFNLDNSFQLNNTGLYLDYETWRILAGIDSIEYYKFIYPGKNIYRSAYSAKRNRTQIAPFVVQKGFVQPVHVVYIDNRPVYFSWSTNNQPYSFNSYSGYHTIKLRLNYGTYTIDSVFIPADKKLIISFDADSVPDKVTYFKMPDKLTKVEQSNLYRYIFPYRNTFGEKFAYIQQGDNVISLKPKLNDPYNYSYYSPYRNNYLAGPVTQSNVEFTLIDGFTFAFEHEPFMEYDFNPGLLKMRSVDTKSYYPLHLPSSAIESITDETMTKNDMLKSWQEYLDFKRSTNNKYRNPYKTLDGHGCLLIDLTETEKVQNVIPLNFIIQDYSEYKFISIYTGNTRRFENLYPGYYKFMILYPGSSYCVIDSIQINANGVNYYKFQKTQECKKDSLSYQINKIIEENIFGTLYNEQLEIMNALNPPVEEDESIDNNPVIYTSMDYSLEDDMVSGTVSDYNTKEPLPGVNILIKGTSIGTVTDIYGKYRMKADPYSSTLIFNYIGYIAVEVPFDKYNVIDVELHEDIQRLDEVIVVGYGVQKKSVLTGAVATIKTKGIPGMSSGLADQLITGRAMGVNIVSDSINSGVTNIRIRGVTTYSFEAKPLYIIDGEVFMGDISDLEAMGIENIEVLKDASATAIYGAMGANGVVLISTKKGSYKSPVKPVNKGADYDNAFFEAASQSSSIRNNFSDYAFWKPTLRTDKDGKVEFEVQFPDDITKWNTYFLAMNGNRQTGQTSNSIKSYKPLMAQLSLPRFLITGDTAFAMGKVLNYSPDSLEVITNYEINEKPVFSNRKMCVNSILDTLMISTQGKDSLQVKYFLKKDDGYYDGELRDLPVFPLGMETTVGQFIALDRDTTLQLSFDTTLNEVSIYARADVLDVIQDEIDQVIHYKYLCNEQLASKLKALLAKRTICDYNKSNFKDDTDVNRIIKLLENNRANNGLWGWWKDSDPVVWISLHALEALIMAKQMGYGANINSEKLIGDLIWELEKNRSFRDKILILEILKKMYAVIDYRTQISKLEYISNQYPDEKFRLAELKQLCGIEQDLSWMKDYEKRTLFGNIYYVLENKDYNLLSNKIQNTIAAYRLLRRDTANHTEQLRKIRNFFFEDRGRGYWRNTYESAQIIETILPDLLKGKKETKLPEIRLSGAIDKLISEFPFDTTLQPTDKLVVSKTGDFPVYFTAYQRYWNNSPEQKRDKFIVSTGFEGGNNSAILNAGKETRMIIDIEVLYDAEYILVDIPIPAGCSYTDKKNHYPYEVHREYFKNKTSVFCEYLAKGRYRFEIDLLPRYTGIYHVNPAKIELMYFPTFYGNNEVKKVVIK